MAHLTSILGVGIKEDTESKGERAGAPGNRDAQWEQSEQRARRRGGEEEEGSRRGVGGKRRRD